jgi:hypothetical protein
MASRSTNYSEWQEHRDLIHMLYVTQNQSQYEVLETLKKPPYCLDATLVVRFIIFCRLLTNHRSSQFERILADVLKISKNLKGEDWIAIDHHKSKRKREDGKDTIVYVNGVAQNPKKLQRQANRHRNRIPVDRGKQHSSTIIASSVLIFHS